MAQEYIWAVSANGVPWRIPAIEDPKCTSQVEWEEMGYQNGSIRTIVASSTTAFAIDRSGKVLMLVLPTHIAIREKVEIYVNQRWYPIIGWQRPLPTDRSKFSDETGRITKDPNYCEVANGWSWEEPWSTHIDPRKYDTDGWQYSFTYMKPNWNKKCNKTDFVRRKILKRHKRYTSHNNWVELSDSDLFSFVELAIGGAEICQDGEILLFALGADGEIYHRAEINTNRPNGSYWERIPKIVANGIEIDDVTVITASPTIGTLVAITWDGKMYHRTGISRNMPRGLTWKPIEAPKNKPVISAAIGTGSLWVSTADGSVWFTRIEMDPKRKEHIMNNVTSGGYQLVTEGGFCKLSITKNEQIVCVSTDNETIHIRTGISANESSGKRFEKVIDRGEPIGQRWVSLYAGTCSFSNVPEYFLTEKSLRSRIEINEFKKAPWRLEILSSLKLTSEKSWAAMGKVKTENLSDEQDEKEQSQTKKFRCQVKTGDTFQSVNITIGNKKLELNLEKDTESIDISEFRSVVPKFQRLPQKYLLRVYRNNEATGYYFAFTDEASRNSFQCVLENEIRESLLESARSVDGECMWSISNEGVVRWHCLAEMKKDNKKMEMTPVLLSEARGFTVDGNLESIDCGAQRIVFGITSNGSLYSLSTKYNPLSPNDQEFDYKMMNEVTLEMFEYQKWAIFRGFITFQGSQKGCSAWMCNDEPVPQSFSSLPTKNWSWVDSNWQLEEEKWKYSTEINGKYDYSDTEQGKVRRRMWKRKAKYESNKSPWCLVESPKMRCVRVAKKENGQGDVTVIALTIDGHILMRNGVNMSNFTGSDWTQIVNDYPVACISIQSHEKLWCLTNDALVMSMNISTSTGAPSFAWHHLAMDLPALMQSFKNAETVDDLDITGTMNIVYVRVKNILYRIDTVKNTFSDPFPMDNLKQAIVNSKGTIGLRGLNITIVYEWMVALYEDKKSTIISTRKLDRAVNLGKEIKCISIY